MSFIDERNALLKNHSTFPHYLQNKNEKFSRWEWLKNRILIFVCEIKTRKISKIVTTHLRASCSKPYSFQGDLTRGRLSPKSLNKEIGPQHIEKITDQETGMKEFFVFKELPLLFFLHVYRWKLAICNDTNFSWNDFYIIIVLKTHLSQWTWFKYVACNLNTSSII